MNGKPTTQAPPNATHDTIWSGLARRIHALAAWLSQPSDVFDLPTRLALMKADVDAGNDAMRRVLAAGQASWPRTDRKVRAR